MKTDRINSIKSDYLLPFRMEYYNQDNLPGDWHPETELYFMLSGTAQVLIEGHSSRMQSEDVFLVNSNEIRQISGDSWEAICILLRPDMLPEALSGHSSLFEINSAGNTYSPRYDYIRYCIAHLAELNTGQENISRSLSIFYALYSHLQDNFSGSLSQRHPESEQHSERLMTIISYINEHYKDNLTLSETAAVFNLSSPYFSAYFRKYTDRTFFDYYNEVRLNHAVRDLLFTGDSIETIAQNNGFSDSRAFTGLFKKKYGTLPNIYRREHQSKETEKMKLTPAGALNESSASVPDTRNIASRANLSKYKSVFREETDFITALSENPRIIDAGTVSALHVQQHLTHNYHNMICVGSARQFFYREIQDMLIRAQKEIGFHYVKFHGLLSDEMMVYAEDATGTPHFSFTFVDKVLDFLQSISLKPLMQLSFMPIALAEDPARMVDFYHYNTSPPKDMNKWCSMIEALVKHCISRYGLEEVKTWLFCVWNEPDETVDQFAWDDRRRFFRFYEQTWKTVKKICPELIFGTPSMLLSIQHESGWAGDFFAYTRQHRCPPDFLNIHYYDNSIFTDDSAERYRGEKGFTAENMEHSFPLTADPHAFIKFINNLRALMRKFNMRHLPVYLTEWNLTISHRDLINDTCFKSCHLIKNLLEAYDRLSSYSYWCLSDFEEELQIAEQLYHGGLGLFTYNAIPKANYTAFRLLGKLGDELLGKGDGYFITRSDNRIVIMLYNYEHYSTLFAAGQRTDRNNSDRYSPFEEMATAQFTVRLEDLEGSRALIREFYVNQLAGSSYDAWARMGSQPFTDTEDYNLLMQQSAPGLYLHQEPLEGGSLTIHTRMAPLEVRLLEIILQ